MTCSGQSPDISLTKLATTGSPNIWVDDSDGPVSFHVGGDIAHLGDNPHRYTIQLSNGTTSATEEIWDTVTATQCLLSAVYWTH
jgi:hypothetical protein